MDEERKRRGERLARLKAESDARVRLPVIGAPLDKYRVPKEELPEIDCAALVHLCKARCCTFRFALSHQDLDEGVVRWDEGEPYVIAQEKGRCVHLDARGGCTVYAQRPRPCRVFDCRDDLRIWKDFEKRLPAD
jgi:Fe-S-cluster containining protein